MVSVNLVPSSSAHCKKNVCTREPEGRKPLLKSVYFLRDDKSSDVERFRFVSRRAKALFKFSVLKVRLK